MNVFNTNIIFYILFLDVKLIIRHEMKCRSSQLFYQFGLYPKLFVSTGCDRLSREAKKNKVKFDGECCWTLKKF